MISVISGEKTEDVSCVLGEKRAIFIFFEERLDGVYRIWTEKLECPLPPGRNMKESDYLFPRAVRTVSVT